MLDDDPEFFDSDAHVALKWHILRIDPLQRGDTSVVRQMATDTYIRNAARELVDRHGKRAVEVSKEHAEMLLKSGDQHAHDIALRVLTEIERILE